MVAILQLALLCAAFTGISFAIDSNNNDGINRLREKMANWRSTKIEQKNTLCPICIEAAEQVPPGVNITLTAEQFLERAPTDAQLQFISRELGQVSRKVYAGGSIPDERREPECTLIVAQLLTTSLTSEDLSGIPLASVPQALKEFDQYVTDLDSEIACGDISIIESVDMLEY